MSDDLIAEIRARHSDRTEIKESGGYMLNGFSALGSLAQSQEDLATALAEIERLTRERDDALSREKDYRDEVELDQFCASSKSKGGWLVIQSLLAEVERLRAALKWYGDPANHYTIPPKTSYDPAYIFVAEPPIFQDSGRRARKALRGEGR